MGRGIELTQEIVRELLDYDQDTGMLTWKKRARHWFSSGRISNSWNSKYSGKEAGYTWTGARGYCNRKITVLDGVYHSHRIIWLWMTGVLPSDELDHIDHDATNNKWSNLRVVSSLENSQNLSMSRRNTSGVTGVSWSKQRGRWCAVVTVRGKSYNLGYFNIEDLDLAAMEVMEFRAEHGFQPAHGLTNSPYYEGEVND